MTEKVRIANIALNMLGEKAITSLDDDSDRARAIKIHYETARDSTLEAHEWTFAIKRWIPSPDATAPVWGPSHAFPIPSDVLRVISVHGDNSSFSVTNDTEQVQWLVERNQVVCDEEVIYCRGIQRVEEEGRFTKLFDQALSAKLASLVAVSVSASVDLQANMLGFYAQFLADAKSRDGLQGRTRRIRNRTLQKSR